MSLFIFPFAVVLGVLLICVLGMAIGVIFGRKPIQHCSSSFKYKGQNIDCPLCSNKECPNQNKGVCTKA
jgi:hypothetical protein